MKGISLSCFVLFSLAWSASGASRDDRVWPISQNNRPLPQSSPFGPRLKASESFRYDFHRGVDIPTPLGTDAVAIDDGEVRLAGLYPGVYSDRVIQVKHADPSGETYYATYIHMQSESVKEGDKVTKGQVLGKTGASVSGFPHLHFEIRWGGLFQYYNVNPWGHLPYAKASSVQINSVTFTRNNTNGYDIAVTVSTAANELDFNKVELYYEKAGGARLNPTFPATFDFNAINRATDSGDYVKTLDGDVQSNIRIAPAKFNTDSARASWTFTFLGATIPSESANLVVEATDVLGVLVKASYPTLDYGGTAGVLKLTAPLFLLTCVSLVMLVVLL